MKERDAGSLARFEKISRLLGELFTPQEVAAWLREPQPLLKDRRPVDLMGTEDGELEIIAVLMRVIDSAYI